MHDHQAAEAITCMTAREEVEAILRAEWALIGLVGPMLGVQWIPGFIRRMSVECGGLPLDSCPFALAEKAGFRVVSIYLPGRCGASTATTLFVQSQGDIYERNLSCLHELLHGLGLRRGCTSTRPTGGSRPPRSCCTSWAARRGPIATRRGR